MLSLPKSTESQLVSELVALGIKRGDLLFVHSSFRSLGPVAGGAAAVIRAIEQVLGVSGLLLMPSFNLVAADQRAATWQPASTPSTVGYLTEFFRRMPGTSRSDHYSHSVAARGRDADAFVAGHMGKGGLDSPWDLEPWGKAYGTDSPMARAYEANGKLLMLGVNYNSATYVHLVEVLWWNAARARDPNAQYIWLDRHRLGAYWDAHGTLRHGRIGHAHCRLFRIRAFVDTLLEVVTRDPTAWMRGHRPAAHKLTPRAKQRG